MAVTCTISKRTNSISATPNHVYHLKPIISRTIDVDEMASRISENCSLTHADVVATLSALNHQILLALKAGHKIDLSWLGSFKIGIETQAHTTPEACGKADIKRVKVNYQPSKNMKKKLKNLTGFNIDSKAKLKYL